MKRSRSTIFLPGVWAVCTVALGFYLASTQGWSLVFRGQQRMFQFDWGYIGDILFHPGGLAALVADFLLQCFTSRGVAAGITAVILGFNSWMVWKLMLRTARSGGRFSEIDDDQIPGAWGLFPACFPTFPRMPSAGSASSKTTTARPRDHRTRRWPCHPSAPLSGTTFCSLRFKKGQPLR